jgi:hypothetical protein
MTRNSLSTTDSDAKRGGVRKALPMCLIALAFLFALAGVQRLVTPKYMTSLYEGAMIAEYYASEKDNEVLFIGDCEVYENFSPITLWEDYGVTSYIRGGPQQLIWQSYYLLEDTLRYETPEIVVFNVLSMKYGKPQSEAYNRLNLDGMRLSLSKAFAVKASMTPKESFFSYLFPIIRFHDRWESLTAEDAAFFLKKDRVTHNGYYMRNDVKPVDVIPDGPKLADYRFDDAGYAYLDKITALCKRKNIKLVLVKAPTIYPHWYPQWDEQMREYAEKHDLLYINFLDHTEEARIDFSADTYDGGLHLNRAGAEKLTAYFGKILKERYGLEDMRQREDVKKRWEEKTRSYYDMAETQTRDIEKYGEIRTFTYAAS